jgi:hypothetical protein
LKTNDLMGFVDGSEPCPPKYVLDDQGKATATLSPTFLLWTKKDQFVLSWLNATLTEKVMSTTFGVIDSPALDKSGTPSPAGLLLIPRPRFLIFSANFRVFIKALKVVLNILKLPSSFLLNLQLWVNRLLKMLLLVTWLVVFTRPSILWLHHYLWLPATNLSLLVSFKMNCSLMSFY